LGVDPSDHVAVDIPAQGTARPGPAHLQQVPAPVLAAVPGGRDHDQPLTEGLHRRVVVVAEALLDDVGNATGGVEIQHAMIKERRLQDLRIEHHATASSACTTIETSSGPPNVVAMATSRASRPRPIMMRPLRRMLLRGSKVHHRSPSHTSIQAAKSIGSGLSGTSRPGRYPKT